jgi:hypothetical protein
MTPNGHLGEGDAYDDAMAELPVSVRLALWVTSAWHGRLSLREALRRSFPDVDHVEGELQQIELWHELGEQALFVALPRPGDVTRMPRTSPEGLAHATDAGECVYAAGLGGLLVPTVTEFGPEGDIGLRVDVAAYDAHPVPRHRLEMLDLGDIERTLLASVRRHGDQLEAVGGSPWGQHHRAEAETSLERSLWGLPAETPPRVLRVVSLAAKVSSLADIAGVSGPPLPGAVDVSTTASRQGLLRALVADADLALADAANVGVMAIAGWRPA